MRRIKRINSHTGHARFLAETDGPYNIVGWIPRQADIPSPYACSPTHGLYNWKGRLVFVVETAHKQYDVFAIPDTMTRYVTDEGATEAYIASRREPVIA